MAIMTTNRLLPCFVAVTARLRILLLIAVLAALTGGATDFDARMRAAGLVDIATLDTTITVNLKYATTDNFVGWNMYGTFRRAYLTRQTAQSLLKALAELRKVNPGYSFIIYDAARPLSVQRTMWDAVKGTPNEKYVAKPYRGGPHNYGMAIDLGLTLNGRVVDMGTPFDTFTEAAHITDEASLVRRGLISAQAKSNRELLRRAMRAAGFTTFSREWWHFTRYSMKYTRAHLRLLDF